MLKHKIIQDYPAFLELRDAWNALVGKADLKGRVFQDHDWLNIWYRNYKHPCSLYNIILYDDHGLIAIAPFCLVPRRRFGVTGVAISFMGISMSDYCDVICDPAYPDKADIYETIFHVIETERRTWSLVSLEEIPQESELFNYVSSTAIHRFSGIASCSECSYADTSRSWNDYSASIFPKGLRRKHRNLAKNRAVEFGQVAELKDVEPFMNALFETHIRRWSNTGDPSRFLESAQRTYFMDMAKSLFPRGMVNMSYLSVDGERVAFHFGFRDEERLYVYLHTFDIEFKEYSIGRLFLYHLIEHSYAKYQYIDFLRGSEAYKEHFNLLHAKNYRFGFYKSGIHMWIHSKLGEKALVE